MLGRCIGHPSLVNGNGWDFGIIVQDKDHVYLRSSNLYLRPGVTGDCFSFRMVEGPKTDDGIFIVISRHDGKFSFKTPYGTYLRASDTGLVDQSPHCQDWESFYVEDGKLPWAALCKYSMIVCLPCSRSYS